VPSVARVWLPAWLFIPRHPPNGKLLLAVESSGRNARWREGDLYQRMAAKGTTVCVADVRGIGDLTPEYSRGAAPYARSHNDDENYGWASLILGQSLAGQRAADILALASALRAHPAGQGRKLKLAASARLTVPALFAAALDRAIDSVYLSAPLVSFANVLAAEEYNVPFGNFVPRLLLHTDLPEIARDLAPRPLCLAGVVGPAGEPVPEPELRRLYSGTHITIRPRAQWDIESLE
jgi:hypothetical protein